MMFRKMRFQCDIKSRGSLKKRFDISFRTISYKIYDFFRRMMPENFRIKGFGENAETANYNLIIGCRLRPAVGMRHASLFF